MSQDIRIPDIGDADDVEVVEILVSAGDEVGNDDPVIVIESDKASMEVPANAAGTIDEVTVSVGDKVSEGQVIAKLKEAAGEAEEETAEKTEQKTEEAEEESRPPEPPPGGDAAAEEDRGPEAAPTEERAADPEGQGGTEDVDVNVPDIGEAENVEVIEVAVKPGDHVDVDDMLVVVESDKASMEIPSTQAGTIKEVHVSVGTQVEEGTRLVTLERDRSPDRDSAVAGKDAEQRKGRDQERAQPPPREAPAAEAPAAEASAAEKKPEQPRREAEPEAPPSSGTSVYAGPAVRRLARELGVDLETVNGTGNRGRIVKDDVKAHVKERMTGGTAGQAGAPMAAGGFPAMPEVDFSRFGEVEEQPLSRIRARGAQNLHRAWLNIPHVTNHDEADVTDLETFRASLKAEGERRGVKVTPLAFIIKACCHALKEYPTVNASLDPSASKFILKRYYHIGMAVDTPNGLVVPVIRDADQKGVWDLSAEIVELAAKARDNKLGMNDASGGSFSVSSLGAIGGTGFTPIINAPEVAILGVGRLAVRPEWRNEAFAPRQMLPLSLSYDHRAINGAEAGRFLARLRELLTDIRRLAL